VSIDLETLIALDEIKRLKARYCQCIDQHRWAEFAALFADDAELTTDREGSVNTMRGRETIVARISKNLDKANTIHHASNPDIHLTSATTAEGIWTASYTNETGPVTGHGHYIERYEKRDGRWLYTHMTLRVHFMIRP
jgi:hypothetical protein